MWALLVLIVAVAGAVTSQDVDDSSELHEDGYDTVDQLPSKANITEDVARLFQDFFAWRLEDNPEFSTQLGNHTYDANLTSYTWDALNLRWNRCQEFLERILVTEVLTQSFTDKINMEVLRAKINVFIRGFDHRGYMFPITYLDGVGNDLGNLVSYMKYDNEEDYRTLIARLEKIPGQVDEMLEMMRQGIELNHTLHRISVETVADQYRALDVPVNQSDLYKPLLEMPGSISEEVQQQLRDDTAHVIRESVFKAFHRIADFMENEYLLHTRPSIAASSLPDGDNYYRECLHYHTSTDMTPEEVHQLGLEEVARIEAQMAQVISEDLGLANMSVEQFSEQLRQNSTNYYLTAEELREGFADIIRDQIRPRMDRVAMTMPKTDVIVEFLPENQKDGLSASYNIPAFDGSRPGKFRINRHLFAEQPKYQMMALSAHEAIPGHHYYFSYLLENEGMPDFRRADSDGPSYSEAPSGFPLNAAMVEGWGLYSEYLGHEMGLYQDPYDRYGRYSEEIVRACRLVVDTGIHAFNWTQQMAVEYMLEHTASSKTQIESEVRRYITWPGQAAAYKVGELRLKRLRQQAESSLASRFDPRVFHRVLLDCAGPLSVLESCVQRYVAADGVWDAWGRQYGPGSGRTTAAGVTSAAVAGCWWSTLQLLVGLLVVAEMILLS